jgi:kinesin family protein 11
MQQTEAEELRMQLSDASDAAVQAHAAASLQLEMVLAEERRQSNQDRQNLLSQITLLINAAGDAQDQRLNNKVSLVKNDIATSNETFVAAKAKYSEGMDQWSQKEKLLVEEVLRSRETLKSKLKQDWMASLHLIAPCVDAS